MTKQFSSENPDPIDIAVGARLRLRRRQLGWTQTQLADALNVTFQQIQKYERGVNRVSASMLVKAAKALDVTVAALVGEDSGAPADPVVVAQLATTGAIELLSAFAKITDGERRRALVTLADAAAQDANRRRSAATPGRRKRACD